MIKKDKLFLLKLARDAIIEYLKTTQKIRIKDVSPSLKIKMGSFVTLHKNGNLRGCIGKLRGEKFLYEDIIDNAISAAFGDPRFTPVLEEDLPNLKIEISLLTKPKEIIFKSTQELLDNINKNEGIILKKDGRSATFLPQVWKQLPEKKLFLQHLSMKAGLPSDSWKTAQIYNYTVEYFEE